MRNKLSSYNNHGFYHITKRFFVHFALFFVFVTLCRLLSNQPPNYSSDLGYVASFSVLFSGITILWNNNGKHFFLLFLFVTVYLSSTICNRATGMILMEGEIIHTIGMSLILFSCASFIYYTATSLKWQFFQKVLKGLALVLFILFLLPALIFSGYAVINHGVFSPDIMLALFQTNTGEAVAYLQGKNLWLWSAGLFGIIAFVVLYVRYAATIRSERFNTFSYVFVLVCLAYSLSALAPKLGLCALVNIVRTTKSTLAGFDAFKHAQNERIARLASLTAKPVQTRHKGVYVLVIGESETRDHMQVYGYHRETTPWLADFAKNEHTVIFNNAYSNHTHTVPALTYALTEKNQYNGVNITDAFSIMEMAKSAGYKTYWLSNQSKYGAWETPIITLAALADVQHWMNFHGGEKVFASYYDEKLVDALPPYDESGKMLIVVHLMGSHATYRDRYPATFGYFKGESRVDAYDNSVRYNDFVLQRIYNKVSEYPNFMAWVYLSDHGEDADNGLSHESSRFTYRMARIPLIVHVSADFAAHRANLLENMINNQNAYWTNDLLYDMMIGMMGIEGLSNTPKRFNVLSAEYDLPREAVRLLHGQKTLESEE